jgi:hypothetical protein
MMTDVTMVVTHHRPVGAFMTALARAPEAERPTTVEGLMQLLAAYVNAHFVSDSADLDTRMPAPDLVTPPAAPGPSDIAVARFEPDREGDTRADPMGRWMVFPYLEIGNIRRGAALGLYQQTARRVSLRLPEPQRLADAEEEARILSQAGDTDKMVGPAYYYDYIASSGKMTTMEYLWSRIGDYTTASCR